MTRKIDLSILTKEAVKKLHEGSWGQIADLIDKASTDGLWMPEYANFSEWMAHLTKEHKISRARCWRYKKAGSFYNKLKTYDSSLCELIDIPQHLSAEALEVLERLENVAPEQFFDNIKQEVLAGTISIRKLKQTWEAYKPAMGGKTRRGRLVSNELEVKINKWQRLEAESMLAIKQHKAWTGEQRPFRCQVFQNVRDEHNRVTYDWLAIVLRSNTAPLEVHGFYLQYQPHEVSKTPEASYVKYRWLVLPEDQLPWPAEKDLHDYGLVGISNGNLQIHKHAEPLSSANSCHDPFVFDLLRMCLSV